MDVQQEARWRATRPALAKETRANTSISVEKKTGLFWELQALEAQNWPYSGKDWEPNAALKVF